jgi:bacterioferritin-associated ferredoxin
MILIIAKTTNVPDSPTFSGNASMIVCVCNNISDREIRQTVDLGVSSMAELRRDLGVATCCGKCASYAKQVLNRHLESKTAFTELSFRAAQAA